MTLQKWCIVQHNKNYLVISSYVYKYSPTIEYASKGKQAEFEYNLLNKWIKSNGGVVNYVKRSTGGINRLLNIRKLGYGGRNTFDYDSMGSESDYGNDRLYNRPPKRKPSAAFISCLFNSSKIRERNLKDSAISPETLDIFIDKYSKDKLNDAWITNISANDYFS